MSIKPVPINTKPTRRAINWPRSILWLLLYVLCQRPWLGISQFNHQESGLVLVASTLTCLYASKVTTSQDFLKHQGLLQFHSMATSKRSLGPVPVAKPRTYFRQAVRRLITYVPNIIPWLTFTPTAKLPNVVADTSPRSSDGVRLSYRKHLQSPKTCAHQVGHDETVAHRNTATHGAVHYCKKMTKYGFLRRQSDLIECPREQSSQVMLLGFTVERSVVGTSL